MVKIRLRRMGSRHKPFFRVVVSDTRRTPTASALEEIGFYDPRKDPSVIKIDLERLEHWVGHGAQLSDAVRKLARQAGSAPAEEVAAEAPTGSPAAEEKAAEEAPGSPAAAEEKAAEEAPAEEKAAEEAPAEEKAAEDAPGSPAAAEEKAAEEAPGSPADDEEKAS